VISTFITFGYYILVQASTPSRFPQFRHAALAPKATLHNLEKSFRAHGHSNAANPGLRPFEYQ
jgi:hypothetical protein